VKTLKNPSPVIKYLNAVVDPHVKHLKLKNLLKGQSKVNSPIIYKNINKDIRKNNPNKNSLCFRKEFPITQFSCLLRIITLNIID
jgi:hypothetical protein